MLLLIFDIDGTLTENNDVATEAFRKSVYDIFGISKYKEDWKDYKNDSDVGILNEIFFSRYNRNLTLQELKQFQNYYLNCFEYLITVKGKRVLPVSGVSEFFRVISGYNDVKIALFTGGFPAVAKRKLDLISIDNKFLLSAAFNGLSRKKIFLRCILNAEKKYRSIFDEIVLFGDSISDIEISNKFNIPLIGITTQLTPEDFILSGAKAAISNYHSLKIEELRNLSIWQ